MSTVHTSVTFEHCTIMYSVLEAFDEPYSAKSAQRNNHQPARLHRMDQGSSLCRLAAGLHGYSAERAKLTIRFV
jgi:hypothetical protein